MSAGHEKKFAGADEIDIGKLTPTYDIKLTPKRFLNETLIPQKFPPEVLFNVFVVRVITFRTSSPV